MGDKTSAPVIDQKTKLLELIVNNDLSISINMSGWLWVLALLILLVFIGIKFIGMHRIQSLELDEAELGIGNQKIKLKPNVIDSQIAYKIWVELSTRKIGIPVELEHDVIAEIYDSWYQFFSVTRELIKEIPVLKLKREETRNIVKLSIDVLNGGIRPHLTSWQARFRKWYENEISNEKNLHSTPQEIQQKFPNYDELTKDLVGVNRKLIKYRQAMFKLVEGL